MPQDWFSTEKYFLLVITRWCEEGASWWTTFHHVEWMINKEKIGRIGHTSWCEYKVLWHMVVRFHDHMDFMSRDRWGSWNNTHGVDINVLFFLKAVLCSTSNVQWWKVKLQKMKVNIDTLCIRHLTPITEVQDDRPCLTSKVGFYNAYYKGTNDCDWIVTYS